MPLKTLLLPVNVQKYAEPRVPSEEGPLFFNLESVYQADISRCCSIDLVYNSLSQCDNEGNESAEVESRRNFSYAPIDPEDERLCADLDFTRQKRITTASASATASSIHSNRKTAGSVSKGRERPKPAESALVDEQPFNSIEDLKRLISSSFSFTETSEIKHPLNPSLRVAEIIPLTPMLHLAELNQINFDTELQGSILNSGILLQERAAGSEKVLEMFVSESQRDYRLCNEYTYQAYSEEGVTLAIDWGAEDLGKFCLVSQKANLRKKRTKSRSGRKQPRILTVARE